MQYQITIIAESDERLDREDFDRVIQWIALYTPGPVKTFTDQSETPNFWTPTLISLEEIEPDWEEVVQKKDRLQKEIKKSNTKLDILNDFLNDHNTKQKKTQRRGVADALHPEDN